MQWVCLSYVFHHQYIAVMPSTSKSASVSLHDRLTVWLLYVHVSSCHRSHPSPIPSHTRPLDIDTDAANTFIIVAVRYCGEVTCNQAVRRAIADDLQQQKVDADQLVNYTVPAVTPCHARIRLGVPRSSANTLSLMTVCLYSVTKIPRLFHADRLRQHTFNLFALRQQISNYRLICCECSI